MHVKYTVNKIENKNDRFSYFYPEIRFKLYILPKSIRNGANNVYFIISAIGSASKLGIISKQCAGTDAVVVD